MRITYILGLLLLMVACKPSSDYQSYQDFAEAEWVYQAPVKFAFPVKSDGQPYDIMIGVRNNTDYNYQNLYVKYRITDSTGVLVKEELVNLQLFHPKTGKPYGKGIGDVCEHEFPLLKDYQFPKPGKYQIAVNQHMRQDTLDNILSIGLRLKKAKAGEE